MIHREAWYREALGMEKELQRAWALYDRTDENSLGFDNGPGAEQALLEVIRLSERMGRNDWGKILEAMHLLLEGRLYDALHSEKANTRVTLTTEPSTRKPCVAVKLAMGSDFPAAMPGSKLVYQTLFYIRGQPQVPERDHLYYFVDYGISFVKSYNPFPEDTVTLDEVEQGISFVKSYNPFPEDTVTLDEVEQGVVEFIRRLL